MQQTYYIRADREPRTINLGTLKGDVASLNFDYSAYADDYGAVTTVTVTVESGQASVGSESLASNVKSLTLTTSQEGRSTIKLSAAGSSDTHILKLLVMTKDPQSVSEDYGFVYG